jgi:hypothetical protein
MEAMVTINLPMEIVLTHEEWERLSRQGGLDGLRARMSPDLAARVQLYEAYPTGFFGNNPTLVVWWFTPAAAALTAEAARR